MRISRWMLGAVAAAGLLLVDMPESQAQVNKAICGHDQQTSFAHVANQYGSGKPVNCRWKCVYKLANGKLHVNSGAKRVDYMQVWTFKDTKKAAVGIVSKVSEEGGCPTK